MRIAALLACLLVTGCENDPVSREGTNNPNVPVALLFKHNGCSIYRFRDSGENHYWADCRTTQSVETNWTTYCGKGCVRHHQDLLTTARN